MKLALFIILLLAASLTKAEDGYDLWLRYNKVSDPVLLTQYKKQLAFPVVTGGSSTINIIKNETSA